ncbi:MULTISPECIES: PAS domain-containing protein [unclassified Streptomyces]|uniref:PAS domain-containing protein n=1 Tax=unclassified Streptomyces TaxID=2593676 RepID=UPI002ED123A1|nr:PAS domain-containing protein [Streptomyces sp. NBC_00891]WSY09269.1 PAS domain-containing protein [Streptomyces sp. NBC_00890]WSZ10891.1 PAS domain-containing protein [Streptomyces sp. NBC_00869]WSZ21605.1 PAS domain-containing protein [Streptomyces sp. NBC_00870]
MSRPPERECGVEALAARLRELRAARAHPPSEYPVLLDAALAELDHAVEALRHAAQAPAPPRTPGAGAAYPFKAIFEHLPWPVILTDEQTQVRRLNTAAAELTGLPQAYAAGRPLAALLRPADRAALRAHTAAVARGDGDRSLSVRLQRLPDGPLHATLTAVEAPGEGRPDVLLMFTPTLAPAGAAHPEPRSTPATVVRQAELTALLDRTARALLAGTSPSSALGAAAGLLRDGLADWALLDLGMPAGPVRVAAHGPTEPEDTALEKVFLRQDPRDCPVAVEVMGSGAAAVEQLTDDPDRLGTDEDGTPLMARAEVASLLSVPLTAPDGTTVLGALTLLRAGAGPPFSLLEAATAEIAAGHLALVAARDGTGGPGRG